jgi:glyoxylase-like metal-dependent hydrolase (beta-lactamase superfamily II)
MKLVPIEGNTQWLDGGSMFGNAPKALWAKWMPPDSQNRILLSCRALLVQLDNGRNILFEAGIGAFFEPKLKERYGVNEENHVLLENLKKLGIDEGSIDAVVLSHLHFDHAGGLLSAYGDVPRLLFPKAKYYVGAKQWKRAENPHIREKASYIASLQPLLKESGRLVLVTESKIEGLDFVRFSFSHGHTVGLMISMINDLDKPLAFASDLIPGMPWLNLPITMGYDRYPELLIEEKKTLLEELAANQGSVFFTHDPLVACASIQKNLETGKFSGTKKY